MAIIERVPIDVARNVHFVARSISTALLSTGSSDVKCNVIKDAATREYWNGSAWVEYTEGNLPGAADLAMTEDADVAGEYLRSVTRDEAGVEYVVKAWDDGDADVAVIVERHIGVQPEEADGAWRVQITVKETDASGDPVPDVTVSIKNASAVEVSRATTGSNGVANALAVIGAGSYTVTMAKSGWSFTDQTLVVAADDASPKTAEYYGTEYATAAPSTPGTCAVEGWLRDSSGTVIVGRTIEVVLCGRPQTADHIYYVAEESNPVTDSEGKFRLVLVQGLLVTIQSIDTNGNPDGDVKRTITVPTSSTAYLDDIAEAA